MWILVPWMPAALVLGLMSTLILVSYSGSALLRGKDPFAIGTNWQHATAHHARANQRTTPIPNRPS
jgi:hypothetical protein